MNEKTDDSSQGIGIRFDIGSKSFKFIITKVSS